MTNRDRMDTMTNEALGRFLYACYLCPPEYQHSCRYSKTGDGHINCVECFIRWLGEEATDETGE